MNESDFDLLDPPSFELPSDYNENPSDYELWSLRVPIQFDISQLNNQTLYIQNHDSETGSKPIKKNVINGPEAILTSFQIEANSEDDILRTYNLSQCQQNETQSFRILKKKSNKKQSTEDDDELSDNNNGSDKEMTPVPLTFSKNLTIVETTHSNITELDLAPSIYKAPKVDLEREKMRIPYVSIDQKSGLKKRWNVFGSNASFIPQQTSQKNVIIDADDTKAGEGSVIPTTPTNHKESGTKRKVSDDDIEESPAIKSPERKKKKKKDKKLKSPKGK